MGASAENKVLVFGANKSSWLADLRVGKGRYKAAINQSYSGVRILKPTLGFKNSFCDAQKANGGGQDW